MTDTAVMEKPNIIYSKRYIPGGKISEELEEKVNKALKNYSDTSLKLTQLQKGIPDDYAILEVYVVGSLLRGVDDSDVDLYIKTKNTDRISGGNYASISDLIKTTSFKCLCESKPKTEWVDIYVGTIGPSKEHFEQKYNYNITEQVLHLIKQYNKSLLETKKEINP